ncbi:MAG: polysaccharide biosynthesis tyrosine autokinase [candidate division WOR-3 bacterium]|nr:polysaccharide biosynthesis tyrosine autokinase [candidate division WOR-3 bacterium]
MNRELTFQDYLDIIYRRRILIVICVLGASFSAFFISLNLPKVYEAKVKFKLELSEAKPVFFTELYTPQRVDPVESELEIIRSRSLARSVVKKLGLNFLVDNHNRLLFDSIQVGERIPAGKYIIKMENDFDFGVYDKREELIGRGRVGEIYSQGGLRFLLKERPSRDHLEFTISNIEKTTEDLMDNISVNQIKNTALVVLKARSTIPELAAKIANALSQEYILYTLESLRQSARGSKEFIESQIKIFGTELDSAEENLRRYKQQSGVFLLSETAKELIDAIAQFEVEKERAVVELHETESSIKKLENELARDEASYGYYKKMASFPTISSSPLIIKLKEQLKELEIQKQEYQNDPVKLKQIQEQIANVEQEIARTSKQIAMAGPSAGDPVFQSLITNIINSETRLIALQSRIEALNQIIEKHNRRLKQLPEAEVNLAQLERQKKANEEIYTMLLSKLEESKIAEAMQISQARIIDSAIVPDKPVEPKPKQNAILGFLLGLLIGIGSAFLLEYIDTTVKTTKEIESLTGITVLATVPFVKNKKHNEIPTISEPHSEIAESYRILRTNLAFSATTRPIKSLLITSTLPQEGKTTTCINLGITLSQQGHRVIILDCDFRRPKLHNYFQEIVKDNHNGLTDVLINRIRLNDAIIKSSFENLYFITSGTIPANPAELLGSLRMNDILSELKNHFDYVLIDAPPALGIADARVLGKICDAIIVVVMSGKTSRDAVLEVKEELERAGEKIIGYVLNGVDIKQRSYRHRYYYYYQHKKI